MAAIFVTTEGGDIFKTARTDSPIIKVDFLDSVIGKGNLAIYTNIGFQLNETQQFFLTFDDIIRFINFGRGLGNIVVNGEIFADCHYSMPGVDALLSAFGNKRGSTCMVSVGSTTFTCVVSSANCSLSAEPDTTFNFSIGLTVIADSL